MTRYGRRSSDQIAKPSGPWIVFVPGQPAEQHEHLISAVLAYLRLRYFASRSAASDVARPDAANSPDQPGEVRPVKRIPTPEGICRTTYPRRHAAAVERERNRAA